MRLYQKIYLSRVILDKSIFIFYHNARPYVRVQIISKEFFDTISSRAMHLRQYLRLHHLQPILYYVKVVIDISVVIALIRYDFDE